MVFNANEKTNQSKEQQCQRVGWIAVLYTVVIESLSYYMTFEYRHDKPCRDYREKITPGREKSNCKGLEVGAYLACLRTSWEASEIGIE